MRFSNSGTGSQSDKTKEKNKEETKLCCIYMTN